MYVVLWGEKGGDFDAWSSKPRVFICIAKASNRTGGVKSCITRPMTPWAVVQWSEKRFFVALSDYYYTTVYEKGGERSSLANAYPEANFLWRFIWSSYIEYPVSFPLLLLLPERLERERERCLRNLLRFTTRERGRRELKIFPNFHLKSSFFSTSALPSLLFPNDFKKEKKGSWKFWGIVR